VIFAKQSSVIPGIQFPPQILSVFCYAVELPAYCLRRFFVDSVHSKKKALSSKEKKIMAKRNETLRNEKATERKK
jgi:hypothetical protein